MARRFLFVIDPIARFLPDKDTTFVFMLESQARGHEVYACEVGDLFVRHSLPHARVVATEVRRATPHYELGASRTVPLSFFDAVFMRKDPPVDQSYLFATYILGLADPSATFVLNSPRGLREANEKLYALNFPDVVPETMVSADVVRLKSFLEELSGKMIIKPLDGCGGAGVFLIESTDRNTNALLELATDQGRRFIMAQRYLPAVRQGDKRIILLDGELLGAVLRVPREDEHRGNIHVGGTAQRTTLTPREEEIVAAVAQRLRDDGLYFVGLDVIGDYLTEVNVTSPTGIQEMNALDDTSLERVVIEFVEQRCPRR